MRLPSLPVALTVAALSCAALPTSPADERVSDSPSAPVTAAVSPEPVAPVALTLPDVAERAVKSVVNVSTTRRVARQPQLDPLFRDFFFGPGPRPDPRRAPRAQEATGSGVILDAAGVVVTNNHVVEGAETVVIALSDGEQYAVEVVGTDPKSDLAVLRITDPPDDLVPLPFADSDALRLGELVLAIGNPFGVGQTVTMGIVSAKGRANVGIVDYEDFIQTDAAINPGNSGGALVDASGQLVGINTAIVSRSGGNQGVGFAIPASMAKPIVESLLADGTVARGWLGVAIQDLDDDLQAALEISEDGVLVSDVVEGSPAANAGLRRGDVLVGLDGEAVSDVRRFRHRVAGLGSGHRFALEVMRNGKRKTLKGTLALLEEGGAVASHSDGEAEAPLAGIRLGPLDGSAQRRVGGTEGVLVTAVEPGSAAARSGLRTGDVVLEVDRKRVSSPDEFWRAWRQAEKAVVMLVHRGTNTIFIVTKK